MKPRHLIGAVLVTLGVLVALNLVIVQRSARAPLHTLKGRLHATPRVDFLFVGDSTMDSGLDPAKFEAAWWQSSTREAKAFNASLRGSGVLDQYLVVREALRQHPETKVVVCSTWNFILTEPVAPHWTNLAGNSAIAYHYEPALAAALYAPGSTFTKLHLQVMRHVPMFTERLTIWGKVETWRREFSSWGMPHPTENELLFPRYSEPAIAAAVSGFKQQCDDAVRHQTPLWTPARELIRHAQERGATVVFVNMPMGSWSHKLFYSTEAWSRYRAHLQALVEKEGALFVEATAWVADENFGDKRHLNPAGAKVFSERLAAWLNHELKSPPPPAPAR